MEEEESREPRVEHTKREAENDDVVERMVDGVSELGAEVEAEATDEGGEPLGEGSDVGAEEGVDRVDQGVVWAEPTVGESVESHPNPWRTSGEDLDPAWLSCRRRRGSVICIRCFCRALSKWMY